MTVLAIFSPDEEAHALRTLRTRLERLGLQSKSSEGSYEYFMVFTARDPDTGIPCDGLFIVTRDHMHFSWSRDGQWPMTDIDGAAHEIVRIIREQHTDDPDSEAGADGRLETLRAGGSSLNLELPPPAADTRRATG